MLDKLKKNFMVCILALPMSVALCGTGFADDDDDGFDFMQDEIDEFDSGDNQDIMFSDDAGGDSVDNAKSVNLNEGAGLVNVSGFDIAGIMLGMSFEDVYNLYHEHSTLYAPRKRNSLVYTIPTDWKYNLDYECRQQNIFVPAQLEQCIRTLAQNRGLLYTTRYTTLSVALLVKYTSTVSPVRGRSKCTSDTYNNPRLRAKPRIHFSNLLGWTTPAWRHS